MWKYNSPKQQKPKPKTAANPNSKKNIIIKNCVPFTDCISDINNTQIVPIPMYNLIECSDNYSKTYGSLWQCYRNETFLNNNGAIANFPDIADNNNSAPFKFKTKIADRIGNYSIKVVKIMVPLKYLSNFWRTLEMSLIN